MQADVCGTGGGLRNRKSHVRMDEAARGVVMRVLKTLEGLSYLTGNLILNTVPVPWCVHSYSLNGVITSGVRMASSQGHFLPIVCLFL